MNTAMKSVVLLSSGLDSTVNLLFALKEGDVLQALTFDYGQKAAKKEIERSQALCAKYSVPHQVIELPFFKQFTRSSLVSDAQVPTGKDVDIRSQDVSVKTAARVWVPNRNGIFLNIAAGFAEGLGADVVVPGFNKEEAATFPDNSIDFQMTLNESFSYSTQTKVSVKCFTVYMNKIEIVKLGLKMGLDVNELWPCYFSGETLCGECESCQRFTRALNDSGFSARRLQ